MAKSTIILVLASAIFSSVSAQSGPWGQCGGIGWTGATTCTAGWTCIYSNPYYSQCLQGSSSSTISTTTTTTTTKSTTTGKPGSSSSVPSTTSTSTSSAASGTTTLQAGYSFIRAVEDPNFHFYLQSETLNTASTAVLGSPATAAQFQVTNGQLIQNANGTPLYAIVASPANSTVTKLLMSWSKTPAAATNGTFVFSGDSLEWSNPNIPRPQTNAWLICPDAAGNRLVYINLGNYDYMTPAGCADETLNAYTGATATP